MPTTHAMPPPIPQLPPQMFTTAAQLLDLTDKKLLLVLRDSRKLIGVLRSWDQFANLVLTDTRERYYAAIPVPCGQATQTQARAQTSLQQQQQQQQEVRKLYCEIPRGTYLVRGENVLVLGEIDLDREDEVPEGWVEGDVREVFEWCREQEQIRKKMEKTRAKKVQNGWGGELEGLGEVLLS